MTHEYVIALNGEVAPHVPGPDGIAATAVGWAAEAVLAVGSDEVVRRISRGDSTFLDLDGCVVTALPNDPERADTIIRATTDPALDISSLLVREGLLGPDPMLEPGSAADLAFWGLGPDPGAPDGRVTMHLVAMVRGGAFTEGDEHRGPFPEPGPR